MNINELWELARWLINGAFDLSLHFVYSSLAGLLAFCLTWWATRFLYFVLICPSRSGMSMPTALARSMWRLSWSAALFSSFAAHCWWDRLLTFG